MERKSTSGIEVIVADGAAAGWLSGSLWLALSLSPFIKQGQTSRIIYQMGQLVSLNTWYEAIRHLITWSLGCSWLGAGQPECTCDGLKPGRQASSGCPPLIGFAVLHWTMEQVEAEREWKDYHVLPGWEPYTLTTPLEYQSKPDDQTWGRPTSSPAMQERIRRDAEKTENPSRLPWRTTFYICNLPGLFPNQKAIDEIGF